MNKDQTSYRTIMKATSLFGGVQVVKILVEIIRSKLIAILLGTSGMGVAGLFTSTIGIIGEFSNFGIGISAIKSIAAANETKDNSRISFVISVYKKIVWFSGFLGAGLTFLFAPYLSELTFGNANFTYGFRWLSLAVLLNRLASGDIALMQGMRKLKFLAKANLFGIILGLLISIPLYYVYRVDGIAPAMLATALSSFLIARFFTKKIKIQTTKVTSKDVILEGKEMLQLGAVLSLSALVAMGTTYGLRVFIANFGTLDEVGLYTAGITIVSGYSGLVFSAMATDYFPRLAGVANDIIKASKIINHQADIGILILAPFLTILLLFINVVILLLYTSSFITVTDMVHWATLGIYFKVVSWSLGYLLLAKGASKLFLASEVFASAYMFALNALGYYIGGLQGLGITFLISNILAVIQMYAITNYFYKFKFTNQFFKIFSVQFCVGLCCFLGIKCLPSFWMYIVGLPLIVVSFVFSYKELDKRIGIKDMLNSFKNKNAK